VAEKKKWGSGVLRSESEAKKSSWKKNGGEKGRKRVAEKK